jgi:putative glutathione S-transferase
MGRLIDGVWHAHPEQTRVSAKGDFVRGRTAFRDRISADGRHPPGAGRYHLWVAHNCPWAHRTIIVRNLKGLTDAISMSVAHFRRNDDGWWFPEGIDDLQPINGQLPLHRIYSLGDDTYTGSATVPVLWDRVERTIVSNESAEIIEMLDEAMGDPAVDLQPMALRDEIDAVNGWVYEHINNGVYRAGFARTQDAYERAYHPLFEALDRVDARLAEHRYLVGDQLTLADVRLFTTLIRFDAVYFSHFKCNRQRITDFEHIWPYLGDLYQTPGFGETVDIELYKRGYYGRSPGLNPRGIIPVGPDIDFTAPHGRGA